jgi:hypothetical protein
MPQRSVTLTALYRSLGTEELVSCRAFACTENRHSTTKLISLPAGGLGCLVSTAAEGLRCANEVPVSF